MNLPEGEGNDSEFKKCIQITSDLQINASQSLHYHKAPAVGWQE